MTDDGDVRDGPEDLEDQRDFLLRSLDDLDNELVAGNIDPDSYRVLHDDYTARASAVIQSIADGVERNAPDAPRVPVAMRVITITGIVVFAVLAAVLLSRAVGQRHPGQQITGDAQAGGSGTPTTLSPTAAVAAAKAAAAAAPKSYDARIRYARALLAAGVYPAALDEYIAAGKLDPTQAEAFAYTGWLTALFARNEPAAAMKQQLFGAAEKSFDRAISLDPAYADTYVFKGLTLSQFENKPCDGATALQQFLTTAPEDHPLRKDVLDALAAAVKAGKCPISTTPTT